MEIELEALWVYSRKQTVNCKSGSFWGLSSVELSTDEDHKKAAPYEHKEPEYSSCVWAVTKLDLSEDDSGTSEHDQENGEEESESASHDDLMHNCWNEEDEILCLLSVNYTLWKSNGILEDVVVEELVHNDVPFPIVASEIFHIPPILIELPVSKSNDLSEDVHPGVKDAIEQDQEADHATDCWENHWLYELSETSWVLSSVLEDRNA